jgi:inorganic pyrophosphatase
MAKLYKLPTWREGGLVNAVIEAPRGCGVKITYDPDLDTFIYGKTLPLGLTYPHCWGFIPSTEADDGDPVDILVLTDVPSYPGVVIPARLIGVLELEQTNEQGKRERNDRLVAVPATSPRNADGLQEPKDMPKRFRREVEEFFLNTTMFTQKNAKLLGWKGSKAAIRLVKESEV